MRTTNNRIHIPSALSALIATVAIMVVSVFPPALAYADGGSVPTVPVQVSKVDADGTALKGAQLRISHKDANGADVIDAEWTSDGTVHTADLPAGDYTLTETTAPEGYDKAADQTFTVKAPENPAPTDYSFTTQSSLTSGALVSKDASKTVSPVYCFNLRKSSPTSGLDYTRVEGSATAFSQLAQRARPGTDLYQDVLRVLYNGYPNNKAGIQQKYNLSDLEFAEATQYAIWYYTDSRPVVPHPYSDAVQALVDSTANIPSGQTLDIYKTSNDQYQNLLATEFHQATPPVNLIMVGQKTQAPTPSQPTTPTQPSTPSTPSTPSQPSTPAQNAPVKPLEKTPQKPSKVTTTQPQVKNLSKYRQQRHHPRDRGRNRPCGRRSPCSRAPSHELNTIRSSSVVGVCPRTRAHPHNACKDRPWDIEEHQGPGKRVNAQHAHPLLPVRYGDLGPGCKRDHSSLRAIWRSSPKSTVRRSCPSVAIWVNVS